MSGERLWAVTAYFNPCGYRSRLANFRAFRARLEVPLVAVELAYGGRAELGPGDADVLVRVPGQDVLWQKERLLNVGLGALPESCDAVAWLDCDVVFAAPGWARRVLEALDVSPVVQPFSTMYDLPRGMGPDDTARCPGERARISLAAGMASGRLPLDIFSTQGASMRLRYSPGHAWAARRSILRAHGLYDAFVMGGGDKVMAAAFFGLARASARAYDLTEARARHYLEWALPLGECVRGQVGFADLVLYHLWHGDPDRRAYGDRYRGFERFDFDPAKDIRLAAGGAWSWSSDKPEMHAHVRRYFAQRHEDGGA
jgi:hypothetical protein